MNEHELFENFFMLKNYQLGISLLGTTVKYRQNDIKIFALWNVYRIFRSIQILCHLKRA